MTERRIGGHPRRGEPVMTPEEADRLCHMVLRLLRALREDQVDRRQRQTPPGPTGLFVPDDVRDCIVGRRGVA